MVCIHCGRLSDSLACPICTQALQDLSYESQYRQRCRLWKATVGQAYPCLFCQRNTGYAPYTRWLQPVEEFKGEGQRSLSKVFHLSSSLCLHQLKILCSSRCPQHKAFDRGFDQMLLIARLLKRTAVPVSAAVRPGREGAE